MKSIFSKLLTVGLLLAVSLMLLENYLKQGDLLKLTPQGIN